MRLISCYIENFGGLSQFSQNFEPGLTVIQQPNGFGKTTLAEFIRAMFYGFPRKNPKQLGRRQKYAPWNGQKCGGHLTFEYRGKQYRIERTFGATPRSDTVTLIDLQTGQKTSRFSEEIGQTLFGLDADSFERSTYLPQSRESGPLTTDSIRAKLTDLVEDTGDVGNFEKAVNVLRARRSGYIPYRGSGGTVAETQARITRLQQNLDAARESEGNLEKAAGEMARLRSEQTRIGGEIAAVRENLKAANEAAARLAHHQHHDRLTASLAAAEEELAALHKRYPKGLPDDAAMEQVSDLVEQAARLASTQIVTAEDRRAAQFVQTHQARFASGVPQAAQFDELRRNWDERRVAEARLEDCALPQAEAAELARLEDLFAPGVPDEETLARCEGELAEAARLRRENTRLAAQTLETVPCKVASPLTVPVLLGCGGVGLLAGIMMLSKGNTVPGVIALTLGLLAMAVAGWLNLRGTMTRQVPGISPQIQALIRENETRAAALEASAGAVTAPYGSADPAELRRLAARLAGLAEREDAFAKTRWELNARLAEYDAVLEAFFETYRCRPEGDSYEALNRFQRLCEGWERASAQLRARDERVEQHRRETEQVRMELERFREAYAVVPRSRGQVLALRDDIRRTAELEAAAAELKQQIAQYRQDHADALAVPAEKTEEPAVLARREAELLARQSRLGDELLRLAQRERLLRDAAERIPELETELERRQAQLQEDRRKAALLDDTVDFLARAKDNLATAYMGPIRERFSGLMERMAGEDPEKIQMTAELEVRLDRGGAGREMAYFSAGQTDMVMLCMRLALVDALFRGAKPALILDDPFVNLDDERMREALALLRELSRDRQIIYLVCNSSRV